MAQGFASDAARRQAYLVMLAAGLGWLFDSVVVNLFTICLPAISITFGLTAGMIGIISSLFLLGYALGTLAGGTMADYIGRRLSLGVSIVLYTVFAATTALAGSAAMLGGLRFLTGVGAGTELPVGAAYVAEVAPDRRRGLWIGVMNSVWSFGIFLAAVILAVLGNWRWAFASTMILGMLVFLVRTRAEESPRFVRVRAALAEKLRADQQAGRPTARRITIAELFRAGNRGHTLRVMLLWLGYWITWWSWSIFVPRYLHLRAGVPGPQVVTVMMAYGLVAFVVQIFAGVVSDWVGRRLTITLTGLIGLGAVWLWTSFASGPWGVVLGGVAFAALLAPPGVLVAYTTELFPTRLRGSGQAMTMGVARLIAVGAPALGGALVARFGMDVEFRTAAAFLLLMVVMSWLSPETAGQPLDGQATAQDVPHGVPGPALV